MTTKQDITEWWSWRPEGATHMLVVCDTFSHEDYPAYVKGTPIQGQIDQFDKGGNMQRVIEVYSAALPFEDQLNEVRAWHP